MNLKSEVKVTPGSRAIRNRIPKSCLSCRKKKLKCDRSRPHCSGCQIRNISDCVYEESQASKKSLKVSKQKKILNPKGSCRLIGIDTLHTNMWDMNYLEKDESSGGMFLFGATAIKTFIMTSNLPFTKKLEQLWDKTKPDRTMWKMEHISSGNNNFLNRNNFEATDEVRLQDLCAELPSYEQLKDIINMFFQESYLYEISNSFKKQDCLNFLSEIFYNDTYKLSLSPHFLIKKDVCKKSYFRLGIILSICSLVHYKNNTPAPIEAFCHRLETISSNNGFFIDQAQFLLLRWYYRKLWIIEVENFDIYNLVGHLINVALSLGFHLNIDKFYKANDDEHIEMLQNLWHWILFADYNISFHLGRPLRINTSIFSGESLLKEQRFKTMGKMIKFLLLVRPIIDQVYDRSSEINVAVNGELVKNFVEEEFKNMDVYFQVSMVSPISSIDLRILTMSLSMLCFLYSARFLLKSERSHSLKNNFIQTILISFQLIADLVLFSFNQDKKYFPELLLDGISVLPPYLTSATSLFEGLFKRSILIFTGSMYYRLTLFEQGSFISEDIQRIEWQLRTLNVPKDFAITLITAFDIFVDIFSSWNEPKYAELKKNMNRFQFYFLAITLENTCRIIVQNVIEFRRRSKDSIAKIINSGIVDLNKTDQRSELNPEQKSLMISSETEESTPRDINGMLYNDFWMKFNDHWTDLLQQDFNLQ